jgi:hypothetical protein
MLSDRSSLGDYTIGKSAHKAIRIDAGPWISWDRKTTREQADTEKASKKYKLSKAEKA